MNYSMARKHATSVSKQSTVCSSREKEFPSYYSLHQYKRKEPGAKHQKLSDTDFIKMKEEG